MSSQNADIRAALKMAKVFYYELAAELGWSDNTLTRRLRHELSSEKKSEILAIIAKLARKKQSVS